MSSLVFNNCCGCIELKTGSLIIGCLNLIVAIVYTVVMAMLVKVGIVLILAGFVNEEDRAMTAGGIIFVVASLELLFDILNVAFGIVLLVGLLQNKAGLVKAYLIYAVIVMVQWCIHVVITVIVAPNAVQIVMDLIFILLNIYFLLPP